MKKRNNSVSSNEILNFGTRVLSHSVSDKVKVNETFRTNNYERFKRLSGNRQLNPVHVERLRESIEKNGMLEVDIIVNQFWEVIDGQNRLEAARRAGVPVYFKIKSGYGLREAQILNENVKSWRKVDYLDSYCEMGHPQYIKFKGFMENYKDDFNFRCCEALINLKTADKSVKVGNVFTSSKYFQTGQLVIPDLEKSVAFAEAIKEIKPFFEGYNDSVFVRTMIFMLSHDGYDNDEFISKLQMRGAPRLWYCKNMAEYKLLIEDIYNYRRRDGDKVNLRY